MVLKAVFKMMVTIFKNQEFFKELITLRFERGKIENIEDPMMVENLVEEKFKNPVVVKEMLVKTFKITMVVVIEVSLLFKDVVEYAEIKTIKYLKEEFKEPVVEKKEFKEMIYEKIKDPIVKKELKDPVVEEEVKEMFKDPVVTEKLKDLVVKEEFKEMVKEPLVEEELNVVENMVVKMIKNYFENLNRNQEGSM